MLRNKVNLQRRIDHNSFRIRSVLMRVSVVCFLRKIFVTYLEVSRVELQEFFSKTTQVLCIVVDNTKRKKGPLNNWKQWRNWKTKEEYQSKWWAWSSLPKLKKHFIDRMNEYEKSRMLCFNNPKLHYTIHHSEN